MSYEILLRYHEEGEEKGQYNREVTKEKVIKIGKPFEEIPLEEVASKIIAQLARRNILVTEVEIYEYYKKKISYNETDDGIKIKGRKFSFDGTVKFDIQDTEEVEDNEQLLNLIKNNPTLIQQLMGKKNGVIAKATAADIPIRFEVFDPVEGVVPPAGTLGGLGHGWKFTKGKRDPIMQEKPVGTNPLLGMLYMTTDDEGKRRELSDRFFVVPPRLDGVFVEDAANYVGAGASEPTLSFGDVVRTDMPDLRRK